jgi:predicted trehalose synthase
MYELRYELNNRPKWVAIPLRGLLNVLDQSGRTAPPSATVDQPVAPQA